MNSKKVIIYSFGGKWSHREQKRFKVEYLLSKGIKVRILSDLVEADYENLQLTKKEFPDFIKNSKKWETCCREHTPVHSLCCNQSL